MTLSCPPEISFSTKRERYARDVDKKREGGWIQASRTISHFACNSQPRFVFLTRLHHHPVGDSTTVEPSRHTAMDLWFKRIVKWIFIYVQIELLPLSSSNLRSEPVFPDENSFHYITSESTICASESTIQYCENGKQCYPWSLRDQPWGLMLWRAHANPLQWLSFIILCGCLSHTRHMSYGIFWDDDTHQRATWLCPFIQVNVGNRVVDRVCDMCLGESSRSCNIADSSQ